jgi:twitching motility protein PilT
MEQLSVYLQNFVTHGSGELHLEPNKAPYFVGASGEIQIPGEPLQGGAISMMIFPIIPAEVKAQLPSQQEVEFNHTAPAGNFRVNIKKSAVGFNVTFRSSGTSATVSAPMQPSPSDAPPVAPGALAPSSASLGSSFSVTGNSQPVQTVPQPTAPAASSFSVSGGNAANNSALVGQSSALEDALAAFDSPQPETMAPAVAVSDEIEILSAPKPAPSPYIEPAVSAPAASYSAGSPSTAAMDVLFHKMTEFGASDLHLSVSQPPMVRKDGKMQPLPCDEQVLTADRMKQLLRSIMPEKNRIEFDERHDTDFAYELKGVARFRANIFMDRKGMGGVFRFIPTKILTAEQLGLPKAIMDLCNLSKGLVVVTGPTGSGKSTTLAAMVDHVNASRDDHIITIEDPIEFVHENKQCLVNQREVYNHTDSFKDALRAALREDPDILLVGEMRDLETISIAIETAETGHLVFGTLHTTTAASTVDRIIDQFPTDRQQQIRVMLSESLKGVISQTLLPKKGGGRVAALEILIVTPAISNLIREGKTFQIPSSMQTGKAQGMVVLNDALIELVKNGTVEPRDAYLKAIDKTGFEALLTRNNFRL